MGQAIWSSTVLRLSLNVFRTDFGSALRQTKEQLSTLGYGVSKIDEVLEPFGRLVPEQPESWSYIQPPPRPSANIRVSRPESSRTTAKSAPLATTPLGYSRASFATSTPRNAPRIGQRVKAGPTANTFDQVIDTGQAAQASRNTTGSYDHINTAGQQSGILHPSPINPGWQQPAFVRPQSQQTARRQMPQNGRIASAHRPSGIDIGVERITMKTPNLKSSPAQTTGARTFNYYAAPPQHFQDTGHMEGVVTQNGPGSHGVLPSTPIAPANTPFLQRAPAFDFSSSSPRWDDSGPGSDYPSKRPRLDDYAYQASPGSRQQMPPPLLPTTHRLPFSTPMIDRGNFNTALNQGSFTPQRFRYY